MKYWYWSHTSCWGAPSRPCAGVWLMGEQPCASRKLTDWRLGRFGLDGTSAVQCGEKNTSSCVWDVCEMPVKSSWGVEGSRRAGWLGRVGGSELPLDSPRHPLATSSGERSCSSALLCSAHDGIHFLSATETIHSCSSFCVRKKNKKKTSSATGKRFPCLRGSSARRRSANAFDWKRALTSVTCPAVLQWYLSFLFFSLLFFEGLEVTVRFRKDSESESVVV